MGEMVWLIQLTFYTYTLSLCVLILPEKYLASENINGVRVDGIQVDDEWRNLAGDLLDIPFPPELNYTKIMGDTYTLKWHIAKDRLEGGLRRLKRFAYLCVETCQEQSQSHVSSLCGPGWDQLKDGTCIL